MKKYVSNFRYIDISFFILWLFFFNIVSGITHQFKVKKKEETELRRKLKKKEYRIFTSIRKIDCALDKLIEIYSSTYFESLNHLKIEEINSNIEMLDSSKNIVKKIEKINGYLLHMGKGCNDTNSHIDSQNNAIETILGV